MAPLLVRSVVLDFSEGVIMSMRKFVLLFCSFVATYAPAALADCSGVMCTSVHVEAINAETSELSAAHDVWVQTTGLESALSCTPDSGVWMKLNMEKPGSKEVYAMLLTAFTTDKLVNIRVVQGSTNCLIAYVFMSR
jgi:hypothetical protein